MEVYIKVAGREEKSELTLTTAVVLNQGRLRLPGATRQCLWTSLLSQLRWVYSSI